MNRRRKNSSGQAIVLVTLALFAMVGMMGLAVDLGWSFFVKKQAQAAADAASMGAVTEAMNRLHGTTAGFTCPANPTGRTSVYCTADSTTRVDCATIAGNTNSNLYNGCLYAKTNGFNWADPQAVTIVSHDGIPPTVSGLSAGTVVYWVTVRTVQTVPQLFSAVLGNTTGVISAISTAAIASTVVPGSFIGLNRAGECMNGSNCGEDINLQGAASLIAQSGIILSSDCHTTSADCTQGVAAYQNGGGSVTGSSIQIQNPGTWTGNFSPTPIDVNASGRNNFDDPTKGLPQPPLAISDPATPCGILSGTTVSNLGPYQYYSYTGTNHAPDGAPINVGGTVAFSKDITCAQSGGYQAPGEVGLDQSSSTFPAYFFYGGLKFQNGAAVNFGPGQYVFVGAQPDSHGNAGKVLDTGGGNATFTGNTVEGTMFIFTAPAADSTAGYPGLGTQINGFPSITNAAAANLWQGSVNLQSGNSGSITLSGVKGGVSGVPDAFSVQSGYTDILFWQDRRNSMVEYNQPHTVNSPCSTCTEDNGAVIIDPITHKALATANELHANKATPSSTEMHLQANANFNVSGVFYQPRGAFFSFQGGGNMVTSIQVITGAFEANGSFSLTLLPVTAPLIDFVVALVQ